jgi:hypothetical protein
LKGFVGDIMNNLYIYGMSHAISLVNYLTGENHKISHNSYSDNDDTNLVHGHGKISIDGFEFNLYTTIFHPTLMSNVGGIAYYDSKGNHIVNEKLLNKIKDAISKYEINYSIGFINGNEHNVSSITRNRFDVDFTLPGYPELNLNSDVIIEKVPASLVKSQIDAWSSGTYAIYKAHFREDAKVHGIVNAKIRMKIYILYIQSLYKNNNEFEYINIKSPFIVNSFEYMPPNYVQGVTHGNVEYANLIFRNFLRSL